MRVFLCVRSCHGLIFALWQEERVAGELAVFLFNEKPSVKTNHQDCCFLPLQPIRVECSQLAQKK